MHSLPNVRDWARASKNSWKSWLTKVLPQNNPERARGVHMWETALATCSSCSLVVRQYLAFWKRLARCIWGSGNVVMSFAEALRVVEETVDDNVLTLADLSSKRLKEKHLTTKSARRRKLCEDFKKASTSELAAKKMKTENQLARVDGVDTKRSRDTLSKSSQLRIQIVPVLTRPNFVLFISDTFRVICLVVGFTSGFVALLLRFCQITVFRTQSWAA